MNFWLCTLLPLPVMAVCWHLYFGFRAKGQRAKKIAVKCGATLMCVLTALTGLLASGENPLTSPVFWGTFFCMLGDGLLEVHFISGMAAFGAGHVFLIAWIAGLYAMSGGLALPYGHSGNLCIRWDARALHFCCIPSF